MIALRFFFAFLVSFSSAAICDASNTDDVSNLFADYLQYTDERPPASFSVGLDPARAKANLENYLVAIRAYLTAEPLSDATKTTIRNEVNTRWANIRVAFNALNDLEKVGIRTCISAKAAAILAIKNARDEARTTALQTGYDSYNNYATAINAALAKWEAAAGSDSVTSLVAAQVSVQTLRIAQRALDFAVFVADLDARLYAGVYLGVQKVAAWFESGATCDATCLNELEVAVQNAVLEVVYTRIAYRRATVLVAKLQADWQAFLASLRTLAEQIKDQVNQEFPKAVERLKAIVNANAAAWKDAVDQALEGLVCDVASAGVTLTFPNNQVNFQVNTLVCNLTLTGRTQAELNQALCDRLVALVAGTGATQPAQFACVPTTTKRSIHSSSINIVGTNSGSGLMATLALLLVTLFFHLF